MDVTLHLSSSALDQEELDAMTRQLAQSLDDETDLAPVLPAGNSAPGAKGDPITIGTLILTFISSGAAVALINVLKAYVSRDPSMKIDLKRPDGSTLTLSTQNMADEQVQKTLAQIKDLVGS